MLVYLGTHTILLTFTFDGNVWGIYLNFIVEMTDVFETMKMIFPLFHVIDADDVDVFGLAR